MSQGGKANTAGSKVPDVQIVGEQSEVIDKRKAQITGIIAQPNTELNQINSKQVQGEPGPLSEASSNQAMSDGEGSQDDEEGE